jgi:hypothetical protein
MKRKLRFLEMLTQKHFEAAETNSIGLKAILFG